MRRRQNDCTGPSDSELAAEKERKAKVRLSHVTTLTLYAAKLRERGSVEFQNLTRSMAV
jgi:hypothetical protein